MNNKKKKRKRKNTSDVMTRGAVQASALLFAAFAEEASTTGKFAEETLPPGRALALAVRVGADAAVLALAFVAAVVTVTLGRALSLAVVTDIA